MKYKTWSKYNNLGYSPYGPGLYGPLGPGPFLVGRTPHQKTHPGKKSPNCVFFVVLGKQKRCAASVRSFWRRYRAEISAMCQKTKVSVFEKRPNFVRNLVRNLPSEFVRNLPSEFASKKWSRKCPSNPTSTCAGGQDDVSSQVNSLKLSLIHISEPTRH